MAATQNYCMSTANALTQDLKEGPTPSGYLFEVVQANGWGYPRYGLLDSRHLPWGWLFTMRATVQEVVAVGTGPNKKAAKYNAAAKMLEILGFECPKYNPLIDKMDNVSTTPQVNQVHEKQVEEEDMTFWNLDPEMCLDQDMCRSPDVIIEEIIDYLDEESVPCETKPVLDLISLSEILLEIETGSEEQALCETQDQDWFLDICPTTEMRNKFSV